MVKYNKNKKIWAAFLTVFLLGCEGFLTGDLLDSNPNKVDDVDQISVESLFVGSQVTMYGFMEGYVNRLVTMFMHQLSGQLYSYADDYNCATIDYSLQNAKSPTPKFRNGKITIMVDTRAAVQDYMLQDDYVAVNDPAVTFSGNLNTSDNVFKLRYSDSDAVNATLSYKLNLWKQTLA